MLLALNIYVGMLCCISCTTVIVEEQLYFGTSFVWLRNVYALPVSLAHKDFLEYTVYMVFISTFTWFRL